MSHVTYQPISDDRYRAPLMDHERLEVYQLALEFHATVMRLVPRRGHRHLRDQLERASLGVVLCIAEGAGRTAAKDKRRFYAMARGSATESAAVLDVLHLRAVASAQDCRQAHAIAVRLVQMLSRLCAPRP
jgi:four helix bundle protein